MAFSQGRSMQGSHARAHISLDEPFQAVRPGSLQVYLQSCDRFVERGPDHDFTASDRSDLQEWWNRMWSQKDDTGTTTQAQEEEQPSR